jgi:protein-tyrosine-phosphatase/predicted ATP-grasp superfamily ATP-dependent carboligase
MKPVLILGEEPRIVVNIARSLHRRGVPVDVAGLSPDAPPVRSNAIGRFTAFPDPRGEPAFSREILLDQIESHHYDQLIPASDTALALVTDHYAELSEWLHVSCPPPTVVHRVLNKSQTLQCARDCEVPIPKSMTVSSLKELTDRGSSLAFPLIAKPCGKGRQATGTFKVRRFERIEQLEQAFTEDPSFGIRNLLQEYCPGEGVGVEVLMHRDRPVVLFQHRRLKELPRTGGVSVLAVSEPVDPLLGDYAVRLLRAMKWDGVAMVEFRVDRPTRHVTLMEVNGRYWGSLGLSIMAGVDFPWYEWQLAHGQCPNVNGRYKIGVVARWTSGAFQRVFAGGPSERGRGTMWGRSRELATFVHHCLPPTRDLLWSIRDPGPGAHETVTTLRALARRALKRVLTPLVPEALLNLRRRSRMLATRSRRMYVWMAMKRALKLTRNRVPNGLRDARSVLFICHGNILRSPMAAALLKQALGACGRTMEVHSAGLHANPFYRADPRGVTVAANFGIALSSHRAEPLTREMVHRADMVFVMDRFNEAELLARYPHVRRKVVCLSLCDAAMPSCLDIHDPYRGTIEDVRLCYEKIHCCIMGLVANLTDAPDRLPSTACAYGVPPKVATGAESLRAGSVRP